jgi:hypothetical protein
MPVGALPARDGIKRENRASRILRVDWCCSIMKQNITISVEKSLLRKARALAAQRGASISALLAQELVRIAERESEYQLARRRALARLSAPFHLGGQQRPTREDLHDRENLR